MALLALVVALLALNHVAVCSASTAVALHRAMTQLTAALGGRRPSVAFCPIDNPDGDSYSSVLAMGQEAFARKDFASSRACYMDAVKKYWDDFDAKAAAQLRAVTESDAIKLASDFTRFSDQVQRIYGNHLATGGTGEDGMGADGGAGGGGYYADEAAAPGTGARNALQQQQQRFADQAPPGAVDLAAAAANHQQQQQSGVSVRRGAPARQQAVLSPVEHDLPMAPPLEELQRAAIGQAVAADSMHAGGSARNDAAPADFGGYDDPAHALAAEALRHADALQREKQAADIARTGVVSLGNV